MKVLLVFTFLGHHAQLFAQENRIQLEFTILRESHNKSKEILVKARNRSEAPKEMTPRVRTFEVNLLKENSESELSEIVSLAPRIELISYRQIF